MQNFRGPCRRGWFGQIASLSHERFCLFWPLRYGHRSHLWTHPHAQYVIIRRYGRGCAFYGLLMCETSVYATVCGRITHQKLHISEKK